MTNNHFKLPLETPGRARRLSWVWSPSRLTWNLKYDEGWSESGDCLILSYNLSTMLWGSGQQSGSKLQSPCIFVFQDALLSKWAYRRRIAYIVCSNSQKFWSPLIIFFPRKRKSKTQDKSCSLGNLFFVTTKCRLLCVMQIWVKLIILIVENVIYDAIFSPMFMYIGWPKKVTNRMLLEPRCTSSIISSGQVVFGRFLQRKFGPTALYFG